MKISIIIPFFNEEKFILKTLNSFSKLIDNFPGSYFVLMDNNSNDHSREIIEHFRKKHANIKIILANEKRQGVKFARKTALEYAYKCGSDIILSTDADTELNKTHFKKLISRLQFFHRSRYDVFVGEGTIDEKIYLRRLIFLGKFVETSRKIWNLHYKLFGPYFFGAFFAIQNKFYGKIRKYFNSENSIVKGEDVLLSRRAYYMGGKFYYTPESFIYTSHRRFSNDPLSWVLGTRGGDYRDISRYNLNNRLKKISQEIDDNIEEIENKIIENAKNKIWSYFEDAFYFNQMTKYRYRRAVNVANRFFRFFLLEKNKEIMEKKDLDLTILKKSFNENAEYIIREYLDFTSKMLHK